MKVEIQDSITMGRVLIANGSIAPGEVILSEYAKWSWSMEPTKESEDLKIRLESFQSRIDDLFISTLLVFLTIDPVDYYVIKGSWLITIVH